MTAIITFTAPDGSTERLTICTKGWEKFCIEYEALHFTVPIRKPEPEDN